MEYLRRPSTIGSEIDHERVARELRQMIQFYDDDALDKLSLVEGWASEDHSRLPYKTSCTNEELRLFVKIYSSLDFTIILHNALIQLSEQAQTASVLPPIALVDRAHVFRKGNSKRPGRRLDELFPGSDWNLLYEIAAKHGLSPAFNGADLIEIDGFYYVIDPFDDSPGEIGRYLGHLDY